MLIKEIVKKTILDILFPVCCLSCKSEGFWLCPNCFSKIQIFDQQLCPACEKMTVPGGKLCRKCKNEKKSRLDGILVATSYENPLIKKMVSLLKYRFIRDLSYPLGRLISEAALRNDISIPDYIVPVPLHPRRLRWRGFNQSELLAQSIARNLLPNFQIDVLDILERKKSTRPQMKVKKYEERQENVKDIFRMKNGISSNIRGKKILLIDDVATTGATLEECAKVLKKAGAKKVQAAVVARQTFHPAE